MVWLACVLVGEGSGTTLLESTPMAHQPNYDFERKERERLKKLKGAERAEAKLKSTTQSRSDNPTPTAGKP